MEVVDKASQAAAKGDLVTVKASFTVLTLQRLERQGTSEAEEWDKLSVGLTFDGRPLEVLDETIHGEYARVLTRAGADGDRPYYLRKEDGRWRLELGAGFRFRRAAAEAPENQPKAEKPDKD